MDNVENDSGYENDVEDVGNDPTVERIFDDVEYNLIKKYIVETTEARLSYLDRLEQKYLKLQHENDVIDMRTLTLVENKGSVARMKIKDFGTLSYSCPEGRKTTKILKKVVKLRRLYQICA